jgi:hypothetical protein
MTPSPSLPARLTGEDREFAAPQPGAARTLREPRPGHHGLCQSKGRARAEVEAREKLTRNEAYHRALLASEELRDDAYQAADQLSADAITDADAKLHQARFSAEARAAATPNAAGWSPTLR